MLDQINVHEYPGLADLGPWNFTTAGLFPEGDGVDSEQLSSGVQVESFHVTASAMSGGRSG